MHRRTFLVVLGAAAVASVQDAWAIDAATEVTTLDAGPLDTFEQEKVYDQFREQGVLLIRRGDEMFALSSVCTHKGCKVRVQDDQTFLCKCHKSRFDADGKVLNGPAATDLLRLKVKRSAEDQVLVRVVKPDLTG